MNSDNKVIPLQLPWLARQAGVSDQRAKALWQEAVAAAVEQCGTGDSPEFARLSIEKLRTLLAAESRRLNTQSAVRTWARLQRQYGILQFAWLEAGNTIAARTWRTLSQQSCA